MLYGDRTTSVYQNFSVHRSRKLYMEVGKQREKAVRYYAMNLLRVIEIM